MHNTQPKGRNSAQLEDLGIPIYKVVKLAATSKNTILRSGGSKLEAGYGICAVSENYAAAWRERSRTAGALLFHLEPIYKGKN